MKCPHSPAAGRRRRRAFTLIELIVSMTVFGLCMLGVMGFFLQSLDIFHFDTGKLQVNRDIRAFTSEMTDNATFANYFEIYTSFTDRDVPKNDGYSGDFLVLVYKDPEDLTKIQRLVGYYRSGGADGEGPVRKFDIDISPSSSDSLDSLLPSSVAIDDYPEVIELSRGLSDGHLFYNFYDRSIMIRGEIIHRGTTTRRATNTYNFTVTPRG